MNHKVSVIINCHNGEKYLSETLKSLENQTFIDYEVIFWDNCSNDNTPNIAKSFDSRIRYYRSDSFTSLGEARNQALMLVEGEYVAFLDSDDLWDPNKLSFQVEYMDQHSEVGILLSNFRMLNMLNDRIIESNNPAIEQDFSFTDFLCDYKYCLSTFLIRKKAIDDSSAWFNPDLQYVEEYDFFAQIAYRWNVHYMSEVLATYRIHKNMNSIALSGKKPEEYMIVLDHLRSIIDDFDRKCPELAAWLCYISALFETKNMVCGGDNKNARKTILPYIKYNYRALAFYLLTFLPKTVSTSIYAWFYKTHL